MCQTQAAAAAGCIPIAKNFLTAETAEAVLLLCDFRFFPGKQLRQPLTVKQGDVAERIGVGVFAIDADFPV